MKLEQEREPEIRTNTDFVIHVENTLGFVLDTSKHPWWKARAIEAGKVDRQRRKRPDLFTMDNLVLTVEWLRLRKQEVRSPAAVCWFVEEALENVHSDPPPDELEALIHDAVAIEMQSSNDHWIGRLTRAQGYEARLETYREWEASRGG